MKRFGLSLALSVLYCLIISANIHAANRILYENFDDQSLADTDLKIITVKDVLTTMSYTTGRGGSGYAARLPGFGEDEFCIDKVFLYQPGNWSGNELYHSVWMRYDSFTLHSPSGNQGNKIWYPRWDGTSSYFAWSGHTASTIWVGALGKGESLIFGPGCTGQHYYVDSGINMQDGDWHQYETYINFSTGMTRFWVDGTLRWERDLSTCDHWQDGSRKWASWNEIRMIFPAETSYQCDASFIREIDDWEVWDGMPGESFTPRKFYTRQPEEEEEPEPPIGLRIIRK